MTVILHHRTQSFRSCVVSDSHLLGIEQIVREHWAKYGRHYYCRYVSVSVCLYLYVYVHICMYGLYVRVRTYVFSLMR